MSQKILPIGSGRSPALSLAMCTTHRYNYCHYAKTRKGCYSGQVHIFNRDTWLGGEVKTFVFIHNGHYALTSVVNYRNARRRSFLNMCIEELYLANGYGGRLKYLTPMHVQSPQDIRKELENIIKPKKISEFMRKLNALRRQLFRPPRTQRKPKMPQRRLTWGTQLLNFKPFRRHLGYHYIRRNYIDLNRNATLAMLKAERIRLIYREPRGTYFPNRLSPFGIMSGIYSLHADMFQNIIRYHMNVIFKKQISDLLPKRASKLYYETSLEIVQESKRLEALLVHEQARLAMIHYKDELYEAHREKLILRRVFALDQRHTLCVKCDIAMLKGEDKNYDWIEEELNETEQNRTEHIRTTLHNICI